MSRGGITCAVSPIGSIAGFSPRRRSAATLPATSPTSRKSKPTSKRVPRSGAPGTIVKTGRPVLPAVATIESITLATVVSPGTKITSAPRAIVDWIASITPDEFSTGASTSVIPSRLQLALASSMKRRELLSAGLWATPTERTVGLIFSSRRNVKSTGARLP